MPAHLTIIALISAVFQRLARLLYRHTHDHDVESHRLVGPVATHPSVARDAGQPPKSMPARRSGVSGQGLQAPFAADFLSSPVGPLLEPEGLFF